MDMYRHEDDRRRLEQQITDWNANRLDLFEISLPTPDGEYFGVIRFFYQDPEAKVSTKCIRVSSFATTIDVLDILIEKFRPDMRMLTSGSYALYEVHVNGEERKLTDKERPLLVQLNWGIDDREGRFLLKNEGAKSVSLHSNLGTQENNPPMKRKLSKREKKEQKKKEKEAKVQPADSKSGEKLYNDLPDSSFTRTISNPEVVMRRRRQQKLEKKLQEIRSKDDQGGTLKIYGDSLSPDVPYKTLLLSVKDTAAFVVKETLCKYGLERENPDQYCLLQVFVPKGTEFTGGPPVDQRDAMILGDSDCPLAILIEELKRDNDVVFKLIRRPADYQQQQRKKKPVPAAALPYLVEINPDGTEPPKALRHPISEYSEVGSDRSVTMNPHFLKLIAQDIHPHHCLLMVRDGIASIEPRHTEAEVVVNNRRLTEGTVLSNGDVLRFGRMYLFRFIQPRPSVTEEDLREPRILQQQPRVEVQQRPEMHHQHQQQRPDVHTQQPRPDIQQQQQLAQRDLRPDTNDLLPALVEFYENMEDHFLSMVIIDINPQVVSFKLAPTYTLYMAIRYRLSNTFRPGISAEERSNWVIGFCNKLADMIYMQIREVHDNSTALSFWMANTSELLHLLKQDVDLSGISGDAQNIIAEAVQLAFHLLIQCLQRELAQVMVAFLDPGSEDLGEEELRPSTTGRPVLADVLSILSASMSMLRRCRVNAALTIQLFSQLFHYINMWLFNQVVLQPQLGLCSSEWGHKLKRRLGRLEAWAEKQGLELAADCHLARIIQAAHLLESPKRTPDDILSISSTCFKLNSLQLRQLLQNYSPRPGEPRIPAELIDRVVSVAQNTADELARSEGRAVRLEEEEDLQLPFLLPEDGYSCDHLKAVPNGLAEFLEPIAGSGVCRLLLSNTATGAWNVYMRGSGGEATLPRPTSAPEKKAEPRVEFVILQKYNGSLGLSIVAATGEGQVDKGIYIKSVVRGGGAERDGRLQAGDQLLEVDSQSLVGVSQEQAAGLMTRTGNRVQLKVAKQAASFHGLDAILRQQSPTPGRPASQLQLPGPPLQQPIRSAASVSNVYDQQDRLDPNKSKSVGQLNHQLPPGQPAFHSGTLPRPGTQQPQPHDVGRQGDLGRHTSQPNLFDRDDQYPDYVNQQEVLNRHPQMSQSMGTLPKDQPQSTGTLPKDQPAYATVGQVRKQPTKGGPQGYGQQVPYRGPQPYVPQQDGALRGPPYDRPGYQDQQRGGPPQPYEGVAPGPSQPYGAPGQQYDMHQRGAQPGYDQRGPSAQQQRDGAYRVGPPQQQPADGTLRGPPPQQQAFDGPQRGPPPSQQPFDGPQRGPPPSQQPFDGPQRGPPPSQQPFDGSLRGPPPQQQVNGPQRGPAPQQQYPDRGPPVQQFDTALKLDPLPKGPQGPPQPYGGPPRSYPQQPQQFDRPPQSGRGQPGSPGSYATYQNVPPPANQAPANYSMVGGRTLDRFPPVNGQDGRSQPVDMRSLPMDGRGQPLNGRSQPIDGRGQPVPDRGLPVDGRGQPVQPVNGRREEPQQKGMYDTLEFPPPPPHLMTPPEPASENYQNLPAPGSYNVPPPASRGFPAPPSRQMDPVKTSDPPLRDNPPQRNPNNRLSMPATKVAPPVPKKPNSGPAIQAKPKINVAAELKKVLAASAWDREEREKEEKRREEERKKIRTEEIYQLESLGPSRTQQQQERLQRLRVDDAFDRRVQEADNMKTDDEEDDLPEPPRNAPQQNSYHNAPPQNSYNAHPQSSYNAPLQNYNAPPQNYQPNYQRPQPPDRKSSYEIYNQTVWQQQAMHEHSMAPPALRSGYGGQKKSVSFHSNLATEIDDEQAGGVL